GVEGARPVERKCPMEAREVPQPGPAPSPPRRALRPRVCAGLILLALAAAGGGWWWYRVTRPAYRVERAREAMRAQDWERVAVLADKLEAQQPDLARLLRGEALLLQGEYADALAEFNRILDRGAIRLEAAALSGRALLQLGETEEAGRVF